MKSNPIITVQVAGGAEIRLGTATTFRFAARDIVQFTGGSSLRGGMSMLWGFLDGDQTHLDGERAAAIAREAAEFQQLFGQQLTPRANRLLSMIATFSAQAK